MEENELERLARLASKADIEKKRRREVLAKKGIREDDTLTEIEKTTGLDETGGITDEELDKIKFYDCGHPCEGRKNLGGICAICGALFCNRIVGNKPSCYRRCVRCHRMMCMKHVRGKAGKAVYCSFKCFILARPLFIVIAGIILVAVLIAVFS